MTVNYNGLQRTTTLTQTHPIAVRCSQLRSDAVISHIALLSTNRRYYTISSVCLCVVYVGTLRGSALSSQSALMLRWVTSTVLTTRSSDTTTARRVLWRVPRSTPAVPRTCRRTTPAAVPQTPSCQQMYGHVYLYHSHSPGVATEQ